MSTRHWIDFLVVVIAAGFVTTIAIKRLMRMWPALTRSERITRSTRLIDYVGCTYLVLVAIVSDSWWVIALIGVLVAATYSVRRFITSRE